jgi:hypothetical protein
MVVLGKPELALHPFDDLGDGQSRLVAIGPSKTDSLDGPIRVQPGFRRFPPDHHADKGFATGFRLLDGLRDRRLQTLPRNRTAVIRRSTLRKPRQFTHPEIWLIQTRAYSAWF